MKIIQNCSVGTVVLTEASISIKQAAHVSVQDEVATSREALDAEKVGWIKIYDSVDQLMGVASIPEIVPEVDDFLGTATYPGSEPVVEVPAEVPAEKPAKTRATKAKAE